MSRADMLIWVLSRTCGTTVLHLQRYEVQHGADGALPPRLPVGIQGLKFLLLTEFDPGWGGGTGWFGWVRTQDVCLARTC